ncbi:hypothetical protein BsWGS_00409 [Bradybaena similaris]
MTVSARALGAEQTAKREAVVVGKDDKKNDEPVNKDKEQTTIGDKLNCSDPKSVNRTECSMSSDASGVNNYLSIILKQMSENRDMLMRTVYVTLGITGLVVVYFVIKSVWLRRKRTKSSIYGVASARGDRKDMEMKPLGDGNDDDDDDYTVFEVNGRKR